MATISIASTDDIPDIMNYLDKSWRKDHILAQNRELFEHEFTCPKTGEINFSIARSDETNEVIGVFSILPFSLADEGDLAGSLWKVDEDKSDERMLGLKLRSHLLDHRPHKFFGTPGPGLQTKTIYSMLRMNWYRMDHYYIRNEKRSDYKIAVFSSYDLAHSYKGKTSQLKTVSLEEIESFPFQNYQNIAPLKDSWYIKHRYLDYPIHDYDVYRIDKADKSCLFVCRLQKSQGSSVYRMVDFIGDESLMPEVCSSLYNYIVEQDCEYVDFMAQGFENSAMNEAGWSILDIDGEGTIIPNWFGPFVRKNVPIYCIADRKTDRQVRLCKADGDQDRPSF